MREGESLGFDPNAQIDHSEAGVISPEVWVRVESRARGEVEHFIESTPEDERKRHILGLLRVHFAREPLSGFLTDDQKQDVRVAVGEIDYAREDVVDAVLQAMKPVLEARAMHALEFEDAEALQIMKEQGFTPVNKRISYSISDQGRLHLHLAPSHERKNEVEDMYRDALHKIVPLVKADSSIVTIGGWSWLNATKTYASMKERLKFTISDIPKEELEAYPSSDDRPKKNALMSREVFLKEYDTQE